MDIIQRGVIVFGKLSSGSATAVELNYSMENNVLPTDHALLFL
jgi:hypothetical protein